MPASASACQPPASLPVSRGSAVDSELEALILAQPHLAGRLLRRMHNVPERMPKRLKQQQQQQQQQEPQPPKAELGRSHYQEEFARKFCRQRSSKAPPAPPTPKRPTVAMATETTQRAHFPLRSQAAQATRAEPPPEDTADWQWRRTQPPVSTSYHDDFPGRSVSRGRQQARPPRSGRAFVRAGTFCGETTSMAAFRAWRAAGGFRYAELPAFMGSVLRFGPSEKAQSVTKAHFVGAKGSPAVPVLPPTDNMATDGRMEFATWHSESYRPPPPNARRSTPAKPGAAAGLGLKLPMRSETQTQADFKGHDTRKHRRPDAIEPPVDTIDLKYSKVREFGTEQRRQFPGIDVTQHPQPSSFKPDNSNFKAPAVAMETETTSALEFSPKSLTDAFRERVKPPQPRRLFAGAFADTTTSGEAFRSRAPPQLRPRHGDFHLAVHRSLRAVHPLVGQSETKEVFVTKPIVPTLPYQPPAGQLAASDDDDERDFQTSHRLAFRTPKFRLTKEQAKVLKAELRRAATANNS